MRMVLYIYDCNSSLDPKTRAQELSVVQEGVVYRFEWATSGISHPKCALSRKNLVFHLGISKHKERRNRRTDLK
jgi:hypothetical protein